MAGSVPGGQHQRRNGKAQCIQTKRQKEEKEKLWLSESVMLNNVCYTKEALQMPPQTLPHQGDNYSSLLLSMALGYISAFLRSNLLGR